MVIKILILALPCRISRILITSQGVFHIGQRMWDNNLSTGRVSGPKIVFRLQLVSDGPELR